MSRRLKLISSLAIVLTGCAIGPDYSRPQINLPAQYMSATGQANEISPLKSDWWTLYNDPVLNNLVETVLKQNVDIRLAVARIEEADANLRVTGAAFLPEIDLN